MEDLGLISRGLYILVGDELGTEKIVDMRRRVMGLDQSLMTASCRDDNLFKDVLLSGSRCEGFRFASSDYDWMLICRGIRVIFSSPTEGQHSEKQTLIIAERDTTKPGFALLRLLNHSADPRVTRACVPYGDKYYVVSQKWRDNMTSLTSVLWSVENIFEGGHRCQYRYQRTPELIEWRISFSATEKVLIHSMNHVQFLCYGLLKIFLKEAIDVNTDIKGLLCSYFLKTALFWEISTGKMQWNGSNFLSCFWKCFCHNLHFAYFLW